MPLRAKSSSKKVGYFMANVARFYFFIDQENPKIMFQILRLKGVVSLGVSHCRGVLAPSHLSGAIWLPFPWTAITLILYFPNDSRKKFHSEYSNQQKEGASPLNLIQFPHDDVLSSRGNKINKHNKVHTTAGCLRVKRKTWKNNGSAQKKGNLKLLIAHQGTFLKQRCWLERQLLPDWGWKSLKRQGFLNFESWKAF